MRASRSTWKVVGLAVVGAVVGTLAGQLLSHQIPMLAHETGVTWHPQANLGVLSYNLVLTFRVNWLTLVGLIAALVIGRKL